MFKYRITDQISAKCIGQGTISNRLECVGQTGNDRCFANIDNNCIRGNTDSHGPVLIYFPAIIANPLFFEIFSIVLSGLIMPVYI